MPKPLKVPKRQGIFLEKIASLVPKKYHAIPANARDWIIMRAINPNGLRVPILPPEKGVIRRGEISPESARLLTVAFTEWPETAPSLWLWARAKARTLRLTAKGQALIALERAPITRKIKRDRQRPAEGKPNDTQEAKNEECLAELEPIDTQALVEEFDFIGPRKAGGGEALKEALRDAKAQGRLRK